jgi:hypothetical protein
MTKHLFSLPRDIFSIIQFCFVDPGDSMVPHFMKQSWKNLMNTSKFFAEIRKETLIWRLNGSVSMKYLTDSLFRDQILSKMARKEKQLCLQLTDVDFTDPTLVENICHLSSLFTLTFQDCNIMDLKDFRNIYCMSILECNDLKEITYLDEKVKLLLIYNCVKLSRGFQNIHNKFVVYETSDCSFPPYYSNIEEMTGILDVRGEVEIVQCIEYFDDGIDVDVNGGEEDSSETLKQGKNNEVLFTFVV